MKCAKLKEIPRRSDADMMNYPMECSAPSSSPPSPLSLSLPLSLDCNIEKILYFSSLFSFHFRLVVAFACELSKRLHVLSIFSAKHINFSEKLFYNQSEGKMPKTFRLRHVFEIFQGITQCKQTERRARERVCVCTVVLPLISASPKSSRTSLHLVWHSTKMKLFNAYEECSLSRSFSRSPGIHYFDVVSSRRLCIF